jgi:hypothetical protein
MFISKNNSLKIRDKISEKETITSIIENDDYIGIFMRASTLLGGRFNHTKDKKKWQAIFYYNFWNTEN